MPLPIWLFDISPLAIEARRSAPRPRPGGSGGHVAGVLATAQLLGPGERAHSSILYQGLGHPLNDGTILRNGLAVESVTWRLGLCTAEAHQAKREGQHRGLPQTGLLPAVLVGIVALRSPSTSRRPSRSSAAQLHGR